MFGLTLWFLWKFYVVAFGIPDYIYSGPSGIQFPHAFHGLVQLAEEVYLHEFAIRKLPENPKHQKCPYCFETFPCGQALIPHPAFRRLCD
jgi:hypothetical protein